MSHKIVSRAGVVVLGATLVWPLIVCAQDAVASDAIPRSAYMIGIPRTAPTPGVPAYINDAVRSWSRTPEDVWNDPKLKPALVVDYIGLKPGERVADFIPGHMYWSRLFSKVVGLQGFVYPFIPQLGCRPAHPGCVAGEITSTSIGYSPKLRPQQTVLGDPRFNGIDEALDVQNIWDFARNMAVVWNVGGQFSLPEQMDVVWSFGHWHNLRTWNYAFPMPQFLSLLYAGIKPGGTLVVADYATAPGKGFSEEQSLHRVDKEAVKAELISAGFEFVSESNLLADPSDDHSRSVDDNAVVVPAGVDIFMLKFRKPVNAPRDRRPTRKDMRGWLDSNFISARAGPMAAGMVWYNSDGTYQEYNAGIGRWFFDASGNICLWNEWPRAVRGLLGCHPWHPQKIGDVFAEDTNRPTLSRETLRKARYYLPPPTSAASRGGNP